MSNQINPLTIFKRNSSDNSKQLLVKALNYRITKQSEIVI